MGAVVYVAWYYVLAAIGDFAYNPLGARLWIAAFFLSVVGLSYMFESVRRRISAWILLACLILTVHYFYMFHRNIGDPRWVTGCYVTVTTIHAMMLTRRSAVTYALLSIALSVWISALHPELWRSILTPGLVTLLFISHMVFRHRIMLMDEVERSRERFRSLFDLSFHGVALVDGGRIVDANATLARMIGQAPEEIVGRSVLEFTSPETRPQLQQKVESGYEGSYEASLRRVDGTDMLVEISVKQYEENGRVLRLASLQDIRDQRRSEQERVLFKSAQEAVRIRDEFIAIASHELKTPLTPLTLQIETLLRAPPVSSSEDSLKLLRGARRQVDRLTQLVNTLLDASRLNTSTVELSLARLDLAAVARDVTESFVAQARGAGAELTFEGPAPGVASAVFDRLRIEQVISNLLRNAITFCERRPIAVRVSVEAPWAVIQVEDHGIGIQAEIQDRIFERFERGVPTRHYGGLGLGLYIVKKIVSAHHGEISLRSEVGRGSTFAVRLPLQQP
jgi:PAS domain S-box-containing protein